jgi:hypothetical protein
VSRAVLTACAGNSSSGSNSLQSQAVSCVRAVCSSISQQHASLVHEEVAAAAKADTRTWKALYSAINAAQPWAPFDAALALLLLPCRRFRLAITAAIHRALHTSAISPQIFAPIFASCAAAPDRDRSFYSGGSSSRSSDGFGGGALLLVDALLRSPLLPQPMQWMECMIVPLIRRSRCSSEVAAHMVVTGAAAVAAVAAAALVTFPPHLVATALSPSLHGDGEVVSGKMGSRAGGGDCAAGRAAHMLQHLAQFHGEALPAHALALLQNAFECSHELIGDNVRWPLARVLALSRANQLRIMQVMVTSVHISSCIMCHCRSK